MLQGGPMVKTVDPSSCLMVVATAFLLVACSSTVSPPEVSDASPARSSSPTPEAFRTVEPTPSRADSTPAPSEGANSALAPDSVAKVVTTDLVVRSHPEISDESEIFTPPLTAPTLLYVTDGPITSNGYEWYQVQPFGMHYLDFMQAAPPFGWVAAASREGEAWIAPTALDCPEPEIEAVRSMGEVARFACYGNEELTIEGQFGGCFVADPAIITPEWLFQTGCALVPPGYREGDIVPDPGPLHMRFTGEVGMPYGTPEALIAATGHFDDPAARACRSTATDVSLGIPVTWAEEPSQVVLWCRAQFVVTRVALINS